MRNISLNIPHITQIGDECAPASFVSVMSYFGSTIDLEALIKKSSKSCKFRDWDYILGTLALKEGFDVTVHSRSLLIFDSTWFKLERINLMRNLRNQRSYLEEISKSLPGFKRLEIEAKCAYKFLDSGGKIDFSPISKNLITGYLKQNLPVIATFTSQLIFGIPKETSISKDPIRGEPWKHTVVIKGYRGDSFFVSDPARKGSTKEYPLQKDLLLDGIIRYDSNLVVISP